MSENHTEKIDNGELGIDGGGHQRRSFGVVEVVHACPK